MAQERTVNDVRQEYVDNFDAKTFLTHCYQESLDPNTKDLSKVRSLGLKFIYECLEAVPEVKGRFLDLANGPSLLSSIPLSKSVSEIIMSGFLENERTEIRKWLNKDPDAYDWQYWFKFAADLEGDGVTGADVEKRIRIKVKDVLPCDIHLTNPLHPHTVEKFDAIFAISVFEPASPTEESYAQAAKNVAGLLKPGGRMIMAGIFGTDYYQFDNHRYGYIAVTAEFIQESFEKAGIENIMMKTMVQPPSTDFFEFKSSGIYVMIGDKKID